MREKRKTKWGGGVIETRFGFWKKVERRGATLYFPTS
jgi:hypothetical protein